MGRHSPGSAHSDYFPAGTFDTANLERKLQSTFAAGDVDAARTILSSLDTMPVAQPDHVDGLRARCKFDAVWLSGGDLERLAEAVEWGMQDFPNLMGIAEDDRELRDADPHYFRAWAVS
jgi:hypothetical protein